MAEDPLRLRILKKLSEVIAEVNPDNDPIYTQDLKNSVFRGRVIFGENDPLPMVSILEVPLPIDQVVAPTGSPASSGAWELIIQGFSCDDHENPTDPAHHLMAQVKRRLVQERKKAQCIMSPEKGIFGMGNHVTDLQISPGVVRPPDELSAKAYFWLAITLKLVEDLDNPYED